MSTRVAKHVIWRERGSRGVRKRNKSCGVPSAADWRMGVGGLGGTKASSLARMRARAPTKRHHTSDQHALLERFYLARRARPPRVRSPLFPRAPIPRRGPAARAGARMRRPMLSAAAVALLSSAGGALAQEQDGQYEAPLGRVVAVPQGASREARARERKAQPTRDAARRADRRSPTPARPLPLPRKTNTHDSHNHHRLTQRQWPTVHPCGHDARAPVALGP